MLLTTRLLVVTLIALSFSGLALAGERCEEIAGLAEWIEPGRVFLLGEMHGTEQSPAFAASVACAVTERDLEVVVGLELAPSMQSQVDRYLDSEGQSADREALLQHVTWTRAYQDGRNSQAMADLIERVRLLKKEVGSASILLFDAASNGGGQDREQGMANNIAASAKTRADAVHVVLSGNLHSRTTTGNRRSRDYEPMGFLIQQQLTGDRVLALNAAHDSGSAWICAPECGVVTLAGNHSGERWSIEIDDATRPSGHRGWYHVGTLSASVPAVGDHEAPQESPVPVEPVKAVTRKDRKTEAVGSKAVEQFQGDWQAYQNGVKSWTMEIEGLAFHAIVSPDEWYKGQLFVRPGDELSEIDFLIEDCVCGYKGQSSDAIYRWDEKRVTVGAPAPGSARPTLFNEQRGEVVQLRRIE